MHVGYCLTTARFHPWKNDTFLSRPPNRWSCWTNRTSPSPRLPS